MLRSTERILTTHVGSLPRPADLLDAVQAKEQGRPVDEKAHAARLAAAVAEIVRKQVELGIDIIDDGEFGKPSFVTYVNERLGGFEVDKAGPGDSPWAGHSRGRCVPGILCRRPSVARSTAMVCTAPVTYRGKAQLQRDIDNLKAGAQRRQAGRGLHAGHFAFERGGLAAQRLLQDRRGIRVRHRRRDARGIQGDRGRRLPAADRRSAPRHLLHRAARASPTAVRKWAELRGRGAQSCAARHPARKRALPHLLRHQHGAARPRHGAQGHRRHHSEDQRRRLFVRGGQPAPRARMAGLGET